MKLDPVIVEAYDWDTNSGWMSQRDLRRAKESRGSRVVLSGFLVRQDSKALVLVTGVSEVDEEDSQAPYLAWVVIPSGCVKSVTHIRQGGIVPRIKKFLKW